MNEIPIWLSYKFKRGIMVKTSKDLNYKEIQSVLNHSVIIPKDTEFVIDKVENRTGREGVLIRNEKWRVWVKKEYLIPIESSQKEGYIQLIISEIGHDKITLKVLQEDIIKKEKSLEILKTLELGYYLFKIMRNYSHYTFLYHLKGFHSRGFKGELLAWDTLPHLVSSLLMPGGYGSQQTILIDIIKATKVSKKEFPLYIGMKHKSSAFDKILKD